MTSHIQTQGKALTETEVIAKVCTLLNNNNYIVWKHHNAGSFNSGAAEILLTKLHRENLNYTEYVKKVKEIIKKCWRAVPLQIKGVPDIAGINLTTGRAVYIEIKLSKDRLRPEQEDFFLKVKGKAECWIIRDFPTFSKQFREQG